MTNYLKQKYNSLITDVQFTEIFTGSIWALSARVLTTLFGLVVSIIIARVYGADVVGVVAVIYSFFVLSTVFTLLGTQTSLLRLIPEHLVKYSPTSACKVYRKTQFMVIGVSVATGLFFFIGAEFIATKVFSKPHLSYYFSIASLFVVFKSLMLLNTTAVRGLRLIKAFAFMQVLPQGCNLFLLICLGLLWHSQDVPVYAFLGSIAITGMLGWIIMEYTFRQKMQPRETVNNMPVRNILSISLPMLMTHAMTFVIGQTGVIMLGMFRSEEEVGYYAIAVKLATLTSFVLNAVNSMAGPKFSELFQSNKMDELFYVAKKSAKLTFWITTPILAGFVILGIPVLHIAFGKDFTTAYPALVLLVIGQFVHSISGATGLFMNMTGNQNVLRNIIVFAGCMNIGLNWFLTPKYGIYGAAFAGALSLTGWNMGALCYIKMKFGKTTGYFPTFGLKN